MSGERLVPSRRWSEPPEELPDSSPKWKATPRNSKRGRGRSNATTTQAGNREKSRLD